jgi:hypothetical protein
MTIKTQKSKRLFELVREIGFGLIKDRELLVRLQ